MEQKGNTYKGRSKYLYSYICICKRHAGEIVGMRKEDQRKEDKKS